MGGPPPFPITLPGGWSDHVLTARAAGVRQVEVSE